MHSVVRYQHVRTLSIVRQLAQGRILTLPTGGTIGMGKDMGIGFIMTESDGEERISSWPTMDLRQLNQLLEQHKIGMVIPVFSRDDQETGGKRWIDISSSST